ncbi:MAG: response regulator transcription factor [Tepidisphaeraceae bacterium]
MSFLTALPGNAAMSKLNDPTKGAWSRSAAALRGKRRVLVVDDERDLTELVAINLQRNGYDVLLAYDGAEALDLAERESPDLILLDLMMPKLDGTEVTRRLKGDPRTAGIPIIMLTAKGEETDIVVGLTLGADDYVTKPFSVKVLMARVASVLRRSDTPPETADVLRAGPLKMDMARHEATVNGESIHLTLTEFKLLAALVSARQRVLTRDQLMTKAMGAGVTVTDRAIDVHITCIRKKLGDANWLIHTVRGVGYRLGENEEAE